MFMKKTAVSRFIFYSLVSLFFLAGMIWAKPEATKQFLESSFLWRDPILGGSACGLVLSILGVYILLNRIVFVSLSISQGASLGIFLCFLVIDLLGMHASENSSLPLMGGFLLASLTALLFVKFRKRSEYPDESLMGLIYIAASGLIVMVGDRIAEGRHSIDTLLFGDAVAVTPQDAHLILALSIPLLLIHFIFRREFVFVSADPEFMKVRGLSTKSWMVLLYFTLTIAITASLKILGSLPVFALMVIPPFIGLKRCAHLKDTFLVSALIGLLLPAFGYFFSFLFSFPTGASLITVALGYVIISWLEGLILK